MTKSNRSLAQRSNRTFRERILQVPFRRRIDLGCFIVVTVGFLAILGITTITYVIGNRSGWFDPPVLQRISDERILDNVWDELGTSELLDAVIHLPDNRLAISQENGTFHAYDPETNLWSEETPFQSTDPIAHSFEALRSGCGGEYTESGEQASLCADSESLWALGNDGSLARRTSSGWDIMVSNSQFVGVASGEPVATDELTTATLSNDPEQEWLLVGTRGNGVGLYNRQSHQWIDTTQVNAIFVRSQTEVTSITHLIWFGDRFWIGTPNGLFQLLIREQTPSISASSVITGQILDLDINATANHLWVLESHLCANAQSNSADACTWLGYLSLGAEEPIAVIDEHNRYPYADLENLFYAQQFDDLLVLAGTDGIYTYHIQTHTWNQVFADGDILDVLRESANNGFYFAYRDGVGEYRPDGSVVTWPLNAELAAGDRVRNLLFGVSERELLLFVEGSGPELSTVLALDTNSGSISLVHQRNRIPQNTGIGDGTLWDPETFMRAVPLGESVMLIGNEGLTLHDTQFRTYVDIPNSLLPNWMRDVNTQFISTSNYIYALTNGTNTQSDLMMLSPDSLRDPDFYVSGAIENAVTIDIPSRVQDVWQWGSDRIGVLSTNGSVHAVAGDQVTQQTGDAIPSLSGVTIQDVVGDQTALWMSSGQAIWRYDLDARSWSIPFQDNQSNIADLLLSENNVFYRTTTGVFANFSDTLIGANAQFNISDAGLSDVLYEGNLLYLAGDEQVQAYNVQTREIEDTWAINQPDALSLIGILRGEPLTSSDTRAYLGAQALAPTSGDITSISYDQDLIWTVRHPPQDPGNNFLMSQPIDDVVDIDSAHCYFRHSSAGSEVSVVSDARLLPGLSGSVLAATNDGLRLYSPESRSWYTVSVNGGNYSRLYMLASNQENYILLVDESAGPSNILLRFFAESDIEIPHSCASNNTITLSSVPTVSAIAYTVDEVSGRAAWIAPNGRVSLWQDNQTSTILNPSGSIDSSLLTRVFDRQSEGFLFFADSTGALWRYDLTLRDWTSIPLQFTDGSHSIVDLNIAFVGSENIVTARTNDDRFYIGVMRSSTLDVTSVTMEFLATGGGLSNSGIDGNLLLDVQHRNANNGIWTFVLQNRVLYFDPIARSWSSSQILPSSDASLQFLRAGSRGILVGNNGARWWIAANGEDHPDSFVPYDRIQTDQENLVDSEGNVWRLSDEGEVYRCDVLTTSPCQMVHSIFRLQQNIVHAFIWNDANAILFETANGLRWYNTSSAEEEIVVPEASNFNGIDAYILQDSQAVFYSDRNDNLLILDQNQSATLYTGVTDIEQSVNGVIWVLANGSWTQLSGNQLLPLSMSGETPNQPLNFFMGANSLPTAIDAAGKLYTLDNSTFMPIGSLLPVSFASVQVDWAHQDQGGDWWLFSDGKIDHVISTECVGNPPYPFTTLQAQNALENATRTAAEQQVQATNMAAAQQPIDAAITPSLAVTEELEDGTEVLHSPPTEILPTIPSLTITPAPSLTPPPIPEPCLYIAESINSGTQGVQIVDARSTQNTTDLIGADGTVIRIQHGLSGPSSVSILVDPTAVSELPLNDMWMSLQPFVLTLASGEQVFDPVVRFEQLSNPTSLAAVRISGQRHTHDIAAYSEAEFERPPALNAIWLAWDRPSSQFQVMTGAGHQNFDPTQFIQNGHLLFEPIAAVTASESNHIWIANTYGIWEYYNRALATTDPQIRFYPHSITLPVSAAHGRFFSGSQEIVISGGAAITQSPTPIIFSIGDVQFSEQPLTRTISVTLTRNNTTVNALVLNGFVWDSARRGVAFEGNQPIIQSEAGIHSALALTSFDQGLNGTALTTGNLISSTNNNVFVFDTSLRQWSQRTSGTWQANVLDPTLNRTMVLDSLWSWQFSGGQLQISLARDPYHFAFTQANMQFNFDHLQGAASFENNLYVATDAFLEAAQPGSELSYLSTSRSDPIFTDRLFTLRSSSGTELYHILGSTRSRFDINTGLFVTDNAPVDPQLERTVAELPHLRFSLAHAGVVKEIALASLPGSSPWVPFDFTSDGRFPFDVVTGMEVFDGHLYTGTVVGLVDYPSTQRTGWLDIQTIVDMRPGSTGIPFGVDRLGIPEGNMGLFIAHNDAVCIQRLAGSSFQACADAAPLQQRMRLDSSLWRWIDDAQAGIIGRYYQVRSNLDGDAITLAEDRLPHDRFDDLIFCNGNTYVTWGNRWLSQYPTDSLSLLLGVNNSIPPNAVANLYCLETPAVFSDAVLSPGMYYQDTAGTYFFQIQGNWQEVTDPFIVGRLTDYITFTPIFQRDRVWLRPQPTLPGSPYVFEQRDLNNVWHALDWEQNLQTTTWATPLDSWRQVVNVNGSYWAATSAGLVPFSRSIAVPNQAFFDLNSLLIVREPLDPAATTLCTITDLRSTPEGVLLRCNSDPAQVYTGTLTSLQDTQVFTPYIPASTTDPSDPFSEQQLVSTQSTGYWEWWMTDRHSGDTGKLHFQLYGEELPLSNGRFSFDTLTSLAAFYPDNNRIELAADAGGWFYVESEQFEVPGYRRPLDGANTDFNHVQITGEVSVNKAAAAIEGNVQVINTTLCLRQSDGTYRLFDLSGPRQDPQATCSEYQDWDGLWLYRTEDNRLTMSAPLSNEGGNRALENGRFMEDRVIGLPITSHHQAGQPLDLSPLYWLPTQAGVLVLDKDWRITSLIGGQFQGLEENQMPTSLYNTSEGVAGYLSTDFSVYALEDQRPLLTIPIQGITSDRLPILEETGVAEGNRLRLRWENETPEWNNWQYYYLSDESIGLRPTNVIDINVSTIQRVIDHSAEWILPSEILTFAFQPEEVGVFFGQNHVCTLFVPNDFVLIDALLYQDRVLLIGRHAMYEINVEPLLSRIFEAENEPCAIEIE